MTHERQRHSIELSAALDLTTLESHLWEAANILRGPVDAADFKTYIFPLLFFRRISDVYDEETQQALDESGSDEEYAKVLQGRRDRASLGIYGTPEDIANAVLFFANDKSRYITGKILLVDGGRKDFL